MTTATSMTLDDMVDKYVRIRDAKGAAKQAFDDETSRMTAALTKLEGLILDRLNAAGAESVKTKFGTAYKKSRSSVSVKDRDEFYSWAVGTDNLGAIDMKANAKAVRELLQKGIEVPGVKYGESIEVGIRRA